ncbi:hypothetical protein PV10_07473 [Exophiala mesophila]|uniref:Uncharacterized protein n=1 Tax=Exophiala mesophila TaxID=212818 RepID=A0A0D1Z5N0_EXOME|nr:uncharacterized protein PV10_07473 [Exophiala mesophila]KIV90132.1 hypothetical protein PV10_07473 [Exophiala mesophila]
MPPNTTFPGLPNQLDLTWSTEWQQRDIDNKHVDNLTSVLEVNAHQQKVVMDVLQRRASNPDNPNPAIVFDKEAVEADPAMLVAMRSNKDAVALDNNEGDNFANLLAALKTVDKITSTTLKTIMEQSIGLSASQSAEVSSLLGRLHRSREMLNTTEKLLAIRAYRSAFKVHHYKRLCASGPHRLELNNV